MTRREALLLALRDAGPRGMTAKEARGVAGKSWRRRLEELRERGYVIREEPSRFRRQGERPPFRWVFLADPPPAPPPPPAEAPLFVPPAPPAASALTRDRDAA